MTLRVFVLILFSVRLCNAQEITKPRTKFRSQFLAPTILISTGLIALTDNEAFDKWEIQEARTHYFPSFRTHVDDYLQFAPIAAAYAMEGFKVRGQHSVGPKTMMLLKSELIMVAITFPLKHLIATPRPDTGLRNSFPSGHTAQAFAAATFFHKEYGHLNRWYSVGAYTVAASVGALRVLNNRHWASDVLVGAGIGILATNLAYLTEPKKRHARHSFPSHITMMPSYSRKAFGLVIGMRV